MCLTQLTDFIFTGVSVGMQTGANPVGCQKDFPTLVQIYFEKARATQV